MLFFQWIIQYRVEVANGSFYRFVTLDNTIISTFASDLWVYVNVNIEMKSLNFIST